MISRFFRNKNLNIPTIKNINMFPYVVVGGNAFNTSQKYFVCILKINI